MKNKTKISSIVMVLALVVAVIMPWHSFIKRKLNLTRSTPIQISNIYITPTDDWLVTGVDSSINLSHEKKLIGISVIKNIHKAFIEKYISDLNIKNSHYDKMKYRVGSKMVDGIESLTKVDNVIYNNIKIALDNDVLITVFYSREGNDSNAKVVESFLSNNIKIGEQ